MSIKFAVAAALSATIVLLGSGCGTETDGDPAVGAQDGLQSNSDRSSDDRLDDSHDEFDAGTVVDCQDLIDSGWTAPAGEPSVSWDPETRVASIAFGDEKPILLNVDDTACAMIPDFELLLTRMLDNYEAGRIEECTQAVKDVPSGVAPTRDGVQGDIEALKAHVFEWCPPEFGQEIRAAEAN